VKNEPSGWNFSRLIRNAFWFVVSPRPPEQRKQPLTSTKTMSGKEKNEGYQFYFLTNFSY
jgi:hypothetical protein